MGLISRVSSRTYRKSTVKMGDRRDRDPDEDRRTIFCKGLPPGVDKRDILELDVSRYAADCRIITDRVTGEHRGFCYLVFDNEKDADQCYEDRRDAKLDGRNLYLDFTGEKSMNKPRRRDDDRRGGYGRDPRDDRRDRDRYDDRRGRDRYDDRRDDRRRSRTPPRRERSHPRRERSRSYDRRR